MEAAFRNGFYRFAERHSYKRIAPHKAAFAYIFSLICENSFSQRKAAGKRIASDIFYLCREIDLSNISITEKRLRIQSRDLVAIKLRRKINSSRKAFSR